MITYHLYLNGDRSELVGCGHMKNGDALYHAGTESDCRRFFENFKKYGGGECELIEVNCASPGTAVRPPMVRVIL